VFLRPHARIPAKMVLSWGGIGAGTDLALWTLKYAALPPRLDALQAASAAIWRNACSNASGG